MAETPAVPLPYRREGSPPFDPADELRRLRAEQPMIPLALPSGAHAWVITRYEDAREVLSDPRFSNSRATQQSLLRAPSGAETPSLVRQPGTLIAYDPPEHTRLRRMLTAEFTAKRINRLRPWLEEIVTRHLDEMERAGPPVDLVRAFALPVPSLVICELLGVPYRDRADFQRRSSMALDLTITREELRAVFAEMFGYMADLVAQQRRDPGDGMLGMLVREHGDELSDAELVGIGNLLLLAGHETTANMLGLGTLLLLQHPEQMAMLRDAPDVVEQAVEELLRYLSIVHFGQIRTATEDVVVGGRLIKADDHVIVSLPSANRDEALCGDPDRFDITRRPAAHLAFGYGFHHCLGASLARTEMQIAYPALLRRFPTLRPAVPFEKVPFRSMTTVYGVRELPVAW